MKESIIDLINDSIRNFTNISNDTSQLLLIEKITNDIIKAFNNNYKLLLCGNGGSAATSSHVAVDLTKNAKIRAINFNEADSLMSSTFFPGSIISI